MASKTLIGLLLVLFGLVVVFGGIAIMMKDPFGAIGMFFIGGFLFLLGLTILQGRLIKWIFE